MCHPAATESQDVSGTGRAISSWLERHAKAIQSVSSLATMFIALLALIGVKAQIDAAARLQQEQSARDIYREYLNLSISRPEFADPDYCAIQGGSQETAYENYVEYLLYTGDQLLATSSAWEPTLLEHLAPHRELLCSDHDWADDSPQIKGLINTFKAQKCTSFTSSCSR